MSTVYLICLTATIYAVAIWGGSWFVGWLTRRLRMPQIEDPGLIRAGRFIGYLERVIIMTLVLLHQYDAIAFVFMAKSIARFDDLKKRHFAEYYLVGTLSSVAVALLLGLLLAYLLSARPLIR
jgi:MFS family permease